MTWTLPEASYLMWLNCERLVDGVERSPFEHFLEHGVALSDGAPFSAPRSARVNYATRRDILDVGLTRMGTALDVAAQSARDRRRH
jgi:cystathionine beta-lyase